MLVDWRIYTWYCPNCKEEVAGLKNKKNQIKVKCSRCGAEMIRLYIFHMVDAMLLVGDVADGGFIVYACQ